MSSKVTSIYSVTFLKPLPHVVSSHSFTFTPLDVAGVQISHPKMQRGKGVTGGGASEIENSRLSSLAVANCEFAIRYGYFGQKLFWCGTKAGELYSHRHHLNVLFIWVSMRTLSSPYEMLVALVRLGSCVWLLISKDILDTVGINSWFWKPNNNSCQDC